jgi:hypothetical protein
MEDPHACNGERNLHRFGLAVVMAISVVLRAVIAHRGGTFFWVDEGRYGSSLTAVSDFSAGHIRGGLNVLFQSADHLLFKFIGLVPAWAERYFASASWVPAVFFGWFSVILIYLVWRLVLEKGGSTLEALFAALLMSECNSFFYYARHVFPYDLSLCFFLWAAICSSRPGFRNNFLTGFLSGTAFLCYNGYWLFGGVILTLATLSRWREIRAMATYALAALLGLVTAMGITGIVAKVLGYDLFKLLIEFSGFSSGDLGNAWRLAGEYFWYSEHYLAVFWAIAFLSLTALWLFGRVERRVAWAMAGAALFYSGIVAYSFHYALFARHFRPLAIFLSVIGAWLLAKLYKTGALGKAACYLLLAGTLVQAGWNMRVPMSQEFPDKFKDGAHSIILRDMETNLGLYQVWADGYDQDAMAKEGRPFRVLLQSPHPIQFLPYALDGWNAQMRAAFRTQDLSMRVVRLLPEKVDGRPQITRTGGLWSPYLGAVRLVVILNPGKMKLPQPLICSGKPGAGDEVFVEFVDPHTIRLAVDHWGSGAVYSQPITCDLSRSHVIEMSLGSLYPDASDNLFRKNPEWLPLKTLALVKFDGAPAIEQEMSFHPSPPGLVEVFHNFQGFSSAEPDFEGRVLSMSWASFGGLTHGVREKEAFSYTPTARVGGQWAPYLGAVRLEVILDPWRSRLPQPLITCGKTGAGDEVFVEFVDAHTIRVGVDHWGTSAVYSPPVPCDLSQPHIFEVSLGSLYPDGSSRQFQEDPLLQSLRNLALVKLDGAVVIKMEKATFPAPPDSATVLHNFLGFSSAVRDFEGTVLSVSPDAPDDLLR